MADVQDVFTYLQNFELASIVERADQQFEEQTGTSRKEASQHEPHGGEWVDTWLGLAHAAGEELSGQFLHLLSGVSLGGPRYEGERIKGGISQGDWKDLYDGVWSRSRAVSEAAQAWQFVMARMMAGELWEAMGRLYAHWDQDEPTDLANDWCDLRPLLQ